MKTRVLWLTKGLGPGGAERLLVAHARVGDTSEFEYEAAYLLASKQHLVPELEAMGVRTHLLDAAREADPRWLGRLRRLLTEGEFDVLHAHSPYPAAGARIVARLLPPKVRPAVMYTEHNRWQSHRVLTRLVNTATYRLDSVHVAVSHEVRDSVASRLRGSVEVITHGIDVGGVAAMARERDAARAELGITDEVVFGTVANLRGTKGYPDLLAAARTVAAARADVVFLAVGQGPMEEELTRLHEELGLGDRFRFLGYRPDATRLMAAFDAFVLASHHEGLPVAIMEALAVGLPIVATTVGGIPEAVTDGVEAILVPPAAPEELARALVAIAADPDRRRAMGGAARTRAAAYDATPAVRRLEELYRSVRRRG